MRSLPLLAWNCPEDCLGSCSGGSPRYSFCCEKRRWLIPRGKAGDLRSVTSRVGTCELRSVFSVGPTCSLGGPKRWSALRCRLKSTIKNKNKNLLLHLPQLSTLETLESPRGWAALGPLSTMWGKAQNPHRPLYSQDSQPFSKVCSNMLTHPGLALWARGCKKNL